jgi:hypothetical protein
MKRGSLKLSALAAGFILAGTAAFTLVGCGGGGSTASTTLTSKISGTVPGTLIEAFCEDGSYYSVSSTNNGTSEHPFEIEIPSSLSCRLVMTTNENDDANKVVTPIGIITADGNGTLFQAAADIDLGYIDLAMSREDINDTEGDGVSDDILSITVGGELFVVELENDPMDSDGDDLLDIYDNDDGDEYSNHDDDDDDNDGILDVDEHDNDLDGDGIDNDNDVDDDNDGLDDDEDDDDDNDGINDDEDPDDDNDGIDDDLEDDDNETSATV